MLSPTLRSALRTVTRELQPHVTQYVQEQVNRVHLSIKPGSTTLDEITNLKGQADGAAELWLQLIAWAEEAPDED